MTVVTSVKRKLLTLLITVMHNLNLCRIFWTTIFTYCGKTSYVQQRPPPARLVRRQSRNLSCPDSRQLSVVIRRQNRLIKCTLIIITKHQIKLLYSNYPIHTATTQIVLPSTIHHLLLVLGSWLLLQQHHNINITPSPHDLT